MNPWRHLNGYYEKRNRRPLSREEKCDGMRPDEWPVSYTPAGVYEAMVQLFFTREK